MICSSCSAEVAPRAPFCAACGHRVEDRFIGSVINDRYRVDGKIAVGGFGAIYRATQINTGRHVAIKIMHEDLGADANLVARFRREGVVLCNLRDAHTVTTYELDETRDGRLFIVMELLDGQNLLDVFRSNGRLPWTRMLAIARSVCSALAEAHSLGIVHRDLKPANIYLERRHDNPDFVKVLDFGIAKIMQESGINDGSELTVMGQAVGTLEYMAPEQLMGGKCDGRTDIYTLGVVAFEMIAGRRPFEGAAGMDLLTIQLSQKPPALSELLPVPEAVDRVLFRCLEQDASDRFADVAELATAFEELLVAIAAAPPVWTAPLGPPSAPWAQVTSAPPDHRRTEIADTAPQLEVPVSDTAPHDATTSPFDMPGSPTVPFDLPLAHIDGPPTVPIDLPVELPLHLASPVVPAAPIVAPPAALLPEAPRGVHPAVALAILLAIALAIGAAIAWLV